MLNGMSAFGTQSFTDKGSVGRGLISVIASATIIAPTSGIVRLTGAVTVSTITPPNNYFNGPIYIFNIDASVGVTDTGGNIALATTFTRYKVFTFIYDRGTAKWYPSATS